MTTWRNMPYQKRSIVSERLYRPLPAARVPVVGVLPQCAGGAAGSTTT